MSLIKCSVCGKMVSDENEVCPECRAWLLGRKTTAPLSDGNIHKDEKIGTFKLIGLFAVLILVVVFSQFLPTRNATDEDGQTTEAEEEVVLEEQDRAEETGNPAVGNEEQTAEEEAQSPLPDVAGTYKGSIRTPTVIRLKQDGTRLSGTIRYTKFDSPALDISGSIKPDGSFSLTEIGEDHRTPSGKLNGRIQGNTMTGTFLNTSTNKTTEFTLNK